MNQNQSKLLFWICVFFLFFFRPLSSLTGVSPFDDACYFERAYEWFDTLPQKQCLNNFYFPGASLSWAPIGLLSKTISTIWNVPFYDLFLNLSGLASFFFWATSLFLLLNYFKDSVFTLLAFGLSLSFMPQILRTPRYAHGTEFLLITIFCLLLAKKKYLYSVIAACALVLTRINDIPVFLLFFAKIADDFPTLTVEEKRKLRFAGIAFFVVALVAIYPLLQIFLIKGYGQTTTLSQLSQFEAGRILPYFLKPFQGFVWVFPGWFLIFIFALFKIKSLNYYAKSVLVWMAFQLWVCIMWDSHTDQLRLMGRYLTATFVPAYFIFQQELNEKQKKWVRAFFAWGAFYQLFFLWGAGSRFTADLPESLYTQPLREWSYYFKYPFISWRLVGVSPLGITFNSFLRLQKLEMSQVTLVLSILLTLLCLVYCVYYLTRRNIFSR